MRLSDRCSDGSGLHDLGRRSWRKRKRSRVSATTEASSLGRPEEFVRYRRLADLDVDEVDMLTVVLVGSSQSRLAKLGEGPRMYTPRGYARKIDGDLAMTQHGGAAPGPLSLPRDIFAQKKLGDRV